MDFAVFDKVYRSIWARSAPSLVCLPSQGNVIQLMCAQGALSRKNNKLDLRVWQRVLSADLFFEESEKLFVYCDILNIFFKIASANPCNKPFLSK